MSIKCASQLIVPLIYCRKLAWSNSTGNWATFVVLHRSWCASSIGGPRSH